MAPDDDTPEGTLVELAAQGAGGSWGEELTVIALLTVRLFVVLRMQPHWALLLGNAWWICSLGFALVLAVAVGPQVGHVVPPTASFAGSGTLGFGAQVVVEALVGAVIGVLVSLPAYGLVAACTGSAAALGTAPRPFVALGVAFAGATALFLGLHHPALQVLADQARALPPGRPELWAARVGEILPWAAAGLDGMLVVALTLATPVLLTVVVLRFSLAAVGGGPREGGPLAHTASAGVASLAAMLALAAAWSAYPVDWARGSVASTEQPPPFWQVRTADRTAGPD